MLLGSSGGNPVPGVLPKGNDLTFAFTESNRFIGITIAASNGVALLDPSEILPRQQILSMPYAIRADVARVANGLDAIGTNASSAVVTTTSGNVGIGIATPESKLTVNGLIETKRDGFKIPDGTMQSTAAAIGGRILGAYQGLANTAVNLDTSWSRIGGLSIGLNQKDPRSNFLITASVGVGSQSDAGPAGEWALRLTRDGVQLALLGSSAGGSMHPITLNYIDEPISTETIVYYIKARASKQNIFQIPGYYSQLNVTSTAIITVVEILE